MRILALFGSVHPYGSERANLEVLRALRDKGANVLLVVNDADYAFEVRDFAAAAGFETISAPYLVPPRPYNKSQPLIDLPIRIARASIKLMGIHSRFKPTHIHLSSQLFVLNFLPALALFRTPIVYRCGDAPVLHNATWRATWRFITWRAARFVAVSRFILERMTAAGVPPDRVTVIYSRPPRRLVTQERHSAETTFNVGYVGQVIAQKGVGLLIEAFKSVCADFPKARLLIAGRIHEEWEGEPWNRALKYETLADPVLGGRVEFLGHVEDVPGFLSRCAIHVAPTLTEEPMANVVIEAKQAGLASIVFRSGGFPEVVEDGVTGSVCPEMSAEALAAALREYLSDPALAKHQGKAARASLTDFGIDVFAERWEEVYAQAAP
ncbi:MAG: glycosyltransferase family 4 protein [Alphaproteobacteria bacterium]